jgi:hypothetical protein
LRGAVGSFGRASIEHGEFESQVEGRGRDVEFVVELDGVAGEGSSARPVRDAGDFGGQDRGASDDEWSPSRSARSISAATGKFAAPRTPASEAQNARRERA